jgi:hypothetical protein
VKDDKWCFISEDIKYPSDVDWLIFDESEYDWGYVKHNCGSFAYIFNPDESWFKLWQCQDCNIEVPEQVQTVARLLVIPWPREKK